MPSTTRTLASRPPSLLNPDASPAEGRVLRNAARAAEDAGDLPGALRLVSQLPDGRMSRRWHRELVSAVLLEPDDLPGLAAWIVHPALRWALERPAGAVFERHADLMLKTMGVGAGERLRRAPAMAGNDPVVVDAGLFDSGLFGDYLSVLNDSPLLAGIAEVKQWPAQLSLVWEVLALAADEVVVRDLCTDAQVRARRYPGAEALAEGALVYGRLVPVPADPGLIFVLPPAQVDQRCAARLVRAHRQSSAAEERLRAVGHSRRRAIQAG